MEIRANQVFRLRQPDRLLTRSWNGERVIFRLDARETHLLSIPCTHVLELLEQSPTSSQALHDSFQALLTGLEEEEVQAQLAQILETLSKLGVIEAFEDVS